MVILKIFLTLYVLLYLFIIKIVMRIFRSIKVRDEDFNPHNFNFPYIYARTWGSYKKKKKQTFVFVIENVKYSFYVITARLGVYLHSKEQFTFYDIFAFFAYSDVYKTFDKNKRKIINKTLYNIL